MLLDGTWFGWIIMNRWSILSFLAYLLVDWLEHIQFLEGVHQAKLYFMWWSKLSIQIVPDRNMLLKILFNSLKILHWYECSKCKTVSSMRHVKINITRLGYWHKKCRCHCTTALYKQKNEDSHSIPFSNISENLTTNWQACCCNPPFKFVNISRCPLRK